MIARTGNNFMRLIVLFFVISFTSVSYAQNVIEIRDPLRGVSYYSVELSTDPLNELQFVENLFPENESITIGISALFFDESRAVDEYILWFHHDGERKWFSASQEYPLTIHVGDYDKVVDYLHITTSGMNQDAFFSEKLEFKLTAEEFLSIVDSDSVSFELTTALGNITKTLNKDEITALLRFDAKVRKLHSESHEAHILSKQDTMSIFEFVN